MFNHKKNILISFTILLILLVLTAAITFVIDPFQHYRKATYYKPYPFGERYMVWGLLDNYNYDSVLVGTSMSENFIKSNIDKELNINILKVSISGASAYEENLIISRAIKNDVKKVIYILDLFSFKGDIKKLGDKEFPFYIQNDTYLDDYKYLLNIDSVLRDSLTIFTTNVLGKNKNLLNFDKFWNWNDGNQFSTKLCTDNYNSFIDKNNSYYASEFDIVNLLKSFNFNLLPHIKNKDIKYIIVFPPYSILTYKLFQHYNKIEEFMEFKRYIINQLSDYNNVTLYDFQIARDVTHNLDNYKDISHYSEDINKWMIKQIKDNNYVITKDNLDKNINILEEQIKNYDFN